MPRGRKPLPLLETPVPNRICWSCRHVWFIAGSPGYSEMTPGSDFELSCWKDYWAFDNNEDSLSDFRTKLQSAERCADFEPHSDGD
jgi:hypothetical protein